MTSSGGTLWHRLPGGGKWIKVGDYPSVVAAATVMAAETEKGTPGGWQALLSGQDPDDDDE